MPAVSTIIAVAAVATAATAGYSAYQAHEAAEEQEDLQKQQAAMEQEAAKGEAEQVRERGRRVLAAQRAALAGSGAKVDEGTGDALQQETRRLTEQDALAVLKEGANRSSLLRGQARITRRQGDAALVAGAGNVVSAGVSGYRSARRIPRSPGYGTPPQLSLDSEAQAFARRSQPRHSLLGGSGKL